MVSVILSNGAHATIVYLHKNTLVQLVELYRELESTKSGEIYIKMQVYNGERKVRAFVVSLSKSFDDLIGTRETLVPFTSVPPPPNEPNPDPTGNGGLAMWGGLPPKAPSRSKK